MVCTICETTLNSNDYSDCFTISLDKLKLHYYNLKNMLQQKDLELHRLTEHIEYLNRQKHQEIDKMETRSSIERLKQDSEVDGSNEMSLSEEESMSPTNLNVALNSEQLFESSLLSPLDAASVTSSEIITSPRSKLTPKSIKHNGSRRFLKDKNVKVFSKRGSVWQSKAQPKFAMKSWASNFISPGTPSQNKLNLKETIIKQETMRKGTTKLSLNSRKANPAKLKQSTIESYNIKEKSFIQSMDDANLATEKSVKSLPSSLQRNGSHVIKTNSTSDCDEPKNISHAINFPIEEIVFDFSPSKKADLSVNILNSPRKPISKLHFIADCNEISTDHVILSNVPSYPSNKLNESSVVMLTPATQDVIFVDDETSDLAVDINTLDLLADLRQNAASHLTHLRECENKNIQKYQNREKTLVMANNEKVIKSSYLASKIKEEKITQDNEILDVEKNMQKYPLHYDDDDKDDDFMPRPIIIKKDPDEALNYKEINDIDCKACKKYLRAYGDRLTNQEIREHLNKCLKHNKPALNHNTPEGFWDPHMRSLKENDPRNQVIIDTRFKGKKRKF